MPSPLLSGSTWTRVSTSSLGEGVGLNGVITTSAGVTFATGLATGQITGAIARYSGSEPRAVPRLQEADECDIQPVITG
jgi:hypothetical protein